MSIQRPHVLNVKFCKHHREVGTTDQIADFLYGCVVPLEEAGIDVIKAGLGCGCTVWMRHDEKRAAVEKAASEKRALPAAPSTVGSGTPAAVHSSRTKGRALRPVCTCSTDVNALGLSDCPVHGRALPFGGK